MRLRPEVSKILALSLILAACGAAAPRPGAPHAPASTTAQPAGLRIKHAAIYVDDQEKALRFYTEVLGFTKKDDETNGPYRWITVVAPEDPAGTELQLALNDDPAAKAFQQARIQQGQPAVMFYTDDIKAAHARLETRGAEFTMPPTEVMPGSTIAQLKDPAGNFIQLTQLDR